MSVLSLINIVLLPEIANSSEEAVHGKWASHCRADEKALYDLLHRKDSGHVYKWMCTLFKIKKEFRALPWVPSEVNLCKEVGLKHTNWTWATFYFMIESDMAVYECYFAATLNGAYHCDPGIKLSGVVYVYTSNGCEVLQCGYTLMLGKDSRLFPRHLCVQCMPFQCCKCQFYWLRRSWIRQKRLESCFTVNTFTC